MDSGVAVDHAERCDKTVSAGIAAGACGSFMGRGKILASRRGAGDELRGFRGDVHYLFWIIHTVLPFP